MHEIFLKPAATGPQDSLEMLFCDLQSGHTSQTHTYAQTQTLQQTLHICSVGVALTEEVRKHRDSHVG